MKKENLQKLNDVLDIKSDSVNHPSRPLVKRTISQTSINITIFFFIYNKNLIIIDPGIGFGKTHDHNLEILARLNELQTLSCPILVGFSRKSTLGLLLELPVEQRIEGTAATVTLAISGGADIVRVHDVKEMVRICRVTDAVVHNWRPLGWKQS